MWTLCKAHLKDLYADQKRYNKATGEKSDSKVRKHEGEKVTLEDSIRNMFKEMSDTSTM